MDADRLQKLTKDYLDTIAHASDFAYVDEEAKIPLTQVYVMLQAIKTEPPKTKEKRNELSLMEEPLDRLSIPDQPKHQVVKQPPILLPKVLAENNHIVLLGEPGAGKTTALKFIGLCFAKENEYWAKEHLNLDEAWIPIKLQLQVYAGDLADQGAQMIPALAHQTLSRLQIINQNEAEELVKNWLETKRLLILLDGLDEVQQNRAGVIKKIRNFAESSVGLFARIVVTSRLAGYTSLGGLFKEFTLKPLQREDEVKSFLRGWLISFESDAPEWKNEIEQQIDELSKGLQDQPSLRRLTNNPLILRMVAEQYAHNKKIASGRAELYKDYVDEAWQRAVQRGAKEANQKVALEALEALAWRFQMGDSTTLENAISILQDKNFHLAEDEIKSKELLALLREKMGLLALVDQKLVFSHTTFREYFVAKRLHRSWKNGKNGPRLTWKFLRPRLHLSAWREPLLLFSSLVDEKEIGTLINSVYYARSSYENRLRRDFMLAASIIGENETKVPSLVKKYVKVLGKWRVIENEDAIKALGKIGAQSIPFLVNAIKNDRFLRGGTFATLLIFLAEGFDLFTDVDYDMHVKVTKIIGEIGTQAIPDLLQAIHDGNKDVRYVATIALGDIGDPRGVLALIEARRDNENIVRRAATQALGKIGTPQAIESLTQALKDNDYGIRHDAAEALGKIGNPVAVPALLQSLNDNHEHLSVRREAADSLGKLGDIRAISGLIVALKDKEPYVRISSARALAQIGDPQVIPALVQALKDERSYDKKSWYGGKEIAEAVGQFGAQAIPFLLQLTKEDQTFRENTAEAMSVMRDPGALPFMLQALEDENPYRREKIAEAIASLILRIKHGKHPIISNELNLLYDNNSTEKLFRLFENINAENSRVRVSIAQAIGYIGDRRAIPLLIQSIEAEDPYMRQTVINSLGQIGDPETIPVLLQAIKDKEKDVQNAAINALAGIDSPQTSSALFQALQETRDSLTRIEISIALGKIGEPKVVSTLLQALENRALRYHTMQALGKIIQSWSSGINPDERLKQIQYLRQFAKSLEKFDSGLDLMIQGAWFEDDYKYYLGIISERLETLTAPQFDPLHPPPPPKWQESLRYAGIAFALMILLSLAALITLALNSAQGTLKGFVEQWMQAQPLSLIIALFLTLPLLSTLIGLTINTLKKRLEK